MWQRTSIMFRSLRTSHVEFRFPVSENLGTSSNGRMEQNFPVIPIFRNFRPTSRGTPKISEWNSGKCLFHSLPNPEFTEFLVEWKAPQSITWYPFFSQRNVCTKARKEPSGINYPRKHRKEKNPSVTHFQRQQKVWKMKRKPQLWNSSYH